MIKIQSTLKRPLSLAVLGTAILFGQTIAYAALPEPQCSSTPSGSPGVLPFSYYKLDETSGQTVADVRGANNGVASATTVVDGKLGKARLLNSSTTTDYLSFGNIPQFNNAQKLTVSAWVKLSQQSGQQAFVSKWGEGAGTFWTDFNNGVPRTAFQAGVWITAADITLSAGEWYHVAWVYDGTASDNATKMRLYVNGLLRKLNFGSASIPASLNQTSAPVMVGSYNTGGNFLLKGAVDEISFWNDATLDGLIVSLYNNNQGITYENILRVDASTLPFSYYKLDETCGQAVTDSTGANNGNAVGSSIINGKLGKARSLNDSTTTDYLSFGNIPQFNNAQKLTVSAWVKLSQQSGQQAFVSKWGEGAGTFWTDFNNGVPRTAFQAGVWITADITLDAGIWYHVVWAYDGTAASNATKMRLYVNGVRRALTFGTASIPASLNQTSAPVVVGSYNTGGNFLLKGAVDEISFWSNAATDARVSNLYNDDPLSNTPNNNPGRGLAYEDLVRAALLHRLSIVVLAHTHDFAFNDLSNARTGGVSAVTAKLTVEGVDWAGGNRCFLDAFGFPGAHDPNDPNGTIPAACLQLPGGWRNRFLLYLDQVKGTATAHPNDVLIVHNTNDILAAKISGKVAVILGSESASQLTEPDNSGTLQGNLSYVQEYYDAGWRETQIHWDNSNLLIATGAGCVNPNVSCLTPFGVDVIGTARDLGILIDVSHTADYDGGVKAIINAAAPSPVIISHDSPRQLSACAGMTDTIIDQVAQSGGGHGVIAMHGLGQYYNCQANNYDPLLLDKFLKGLNYVKVRVGANHLALGPDYFPENGYVFVTPVTNTSDITLGLVRLGYSDEAIQRILGQNMLDLYGRVWK